MGSVEESAVILFELQGKSDQFLKYIKKNGIKKTGVYELDFLNIKVI